MKKENNKHNKQNKNNMNLLVALALLVVAVALAVSIYFIVTNKEKKEPIAYTQFLQDIDEGKIEKIEMTVGSGNLKVTYKEREKEEDKEKVIIPNTQAFIELIHEKRQEQDFELEEKSSGFFCCN